MIGFHFQTNQVNDWPRAVAQLPAGTWVKAINDVHILRDAKAANPGIKTLLRYFYSPHQNFGGTVEENKQRARVFFDHFIDGTFMTMAQHVDAVEEWNEYHAEGQPEQEIIERVRWARAVAQVWAEEYRTRPGLGHIRLVLANTAIGNTIPHAYGQIAHQYDCIMGYHAYVPVNRYRHPAPWHILPGEWPHYSGRWVAMDERWRAEGIYVPWLFTEFGAVSEQNGHLGPDDGWRHDLVYGGDLQKYLGMMNYFMTQAMNTNAYRNGRVLGATIFNSGGNADWQWFEVRQPEMDAIAQYVRDFAPSPPPPPPPPPPPGGISPELRQEMMAASVQEQIARGIPLNPNAALQRAIFAAGMVPVHREITVGGYTIQAAESLTGSPARRVYYWRDNGAVFGWF